MSKDYPEIEIKAGDSHGSGSSHSTYYKVEVRSSYVQPTVIDKDFVIDFVWRTLPIREGATQQGGRNVPVHYFDRKALEIGLLPFIAAEAHRWAFLAELEANKFLSGSLCIETRLVAVEFRYSYETKEIGVSDKLARGLSPSNAGKVEFTPRNTKEPSE